jgi:hypothetical protein
LKVTEVIKVLELEDVAIALRKALDEHIAQSRAIPAKSNSDLYGGGTEQ